MRESQKSQNTSEKAGKGIKMRCVSVWFSARVWWRQWWCALCVWFSSHLRPSRAPWGARLRAGCCRSRPRPPGCLPPPRCAACPRHLSPSRRPPHYCSSSLCQETGGRGENGQFRLCPFYKLALKGQGVGYWLRVVLYSVTIRCAERERPWVRGVKCVFYVA